MQSFASLSKRIIPAIVLMLVLLIALAIPAGAHDSTGDSVFVSIRHYAGLDPDGQDELYRLTAEGFLPLIRESEGYIGYYWLHEGEDVVAVSLFENQEQAAASSESAREYVAANLAHLVQGPPRTVEGQVDIGFVEMLDGMGDGAVSSLHASVRIYDDFEADDLAEFVAIVEDGFLPIMRETDGFFGYYLMNDGAETVTAISIFDSEASSLASNENAREFVAENLTAYLPSAPAIVSGRVGIASLAGLNDGANLIDDAPVFVSIRVYDGVDPMDRDEIVRLVDPVFLSIMRESDGFVGYYLLPAGDKLAAVSMFDSAGQAAASNEKARDYVAEFMAPLLPNAPLIVEGHIDIAYVDDADDMTMPELYASLRIYHVSDMGRLEESNELVKAYLLPALHEAGGLFSYYSLSDSEDTIVGFNVYESEENALATSDIAAAFIAEHNMDWLPDDPLRVNGQLGVAALAGIQMGENLVGETTQDSVFASVRVYDGIDPANQAEIARLTAAGFLPIMRESDGFVGYYLMPAGESLAAISLFNSAEQAAASTEKAREFVVENLAPLLPNAPTVVEGTLSIYQVAALSGAEGLGGDGELYASIRFYTGFDLTHFDEANELAKAQLLPALQELGGMFAQFALNDGEDTVVGISIFDSEAASLAANDVGKAFTIEYLADWAPNPPTGPSGKLAIAAQAEINMGENLVGAMME